MINRIREVMDNNGDNHHFTKQNHFMTQTLEKKIESFLQTKNEIQELNDSGEDFDYSVPLEMMETASEIIAELQKEREEKLNEVYKLLDGKSI